MTSFLDLSDIADRLVEESVKNYRKAYTDTAYGRIIEDASRYIGQEASRHDVTILTDSNHGNLAGKALMAYPLFSTMAAQAGVRHIGIEYPKSHQILLDKLSDGGISRDTFINIHVARFDSKMWVRTALDKYDYLREAEYVADLVLNAKSQGIKVWALDHQRGDIYFDKSGKVNLEGRAEAEAMFMKDFLKLARNSPYFNPEVSSLKASGLGMAERRDIYISAFKNHPAIKGFKEQYPGYIPDPGLALRLQMDFLVAKDIALIREQHGGKMLAEYGRGHTKRLTGDLDWSLKTLGESVKVIDIYGNMQDFKSMSLLGCRQVGGRMDCERPDSNDRLIVEAGLLEKGVPEKQWPPIRPGKPMALAP